MLSRNPRPAADGQAVGDHAQFSGFSRISSYLTKDSIVQM